MAWLLKRTIAIILLALLLVLVVRCFASLHRNPLADVLQSDIGPLNQACWHYICPGRTSFGEADALIRAQPNRVNHIYFHKYPGSSTSLCWSDAFLLGATVCAEQPQPGTDIIDYVQIGPLGDDFPVSLGDLISVFGAPSSANLCVRGEPDLQNSQATSVEVTYKAMHVMLEAYNSHLPAWKIDPTQTIHYVEFYNSTIPLYDGVTWDWRGFVHGPGWVVVCNG